MIDWLNVREKFGMLSDFYMLEIKIFGLIFGKDEAIFIHVWLYSYWRLEALGLFGLFTHDPHGSKT